MDSNNPGLNATGYGWLMLAGIFVTLGLWSRLARRDGGLAAIYVAALAGAFCGAKVAYLVAEGWMFWHAENRWLLLATGKSITGALLGGYAGVEIAKGCVNYRQATGDWFALVAPIGILLGRLGCMLHGCCLGVICDPNWFTVVDARGTARWPAAQVEFAFNAAALGVLGLLRWRRLFPNQLFHLYLIAYGLLRFGHEFYRDTPRWFFGLSGYHALALLLAGFGLERFLARRAAEGRATCGLARSAERSVAADAAVPR